MFDFQAQIAADFQAQQFRDMEAQARFRYGNTNARCVSAADASQAAEDAAWLADWQVTKDKIQREGDALSREIEISKQETKARKTAPLFSQEEDAKWEAEFKARVAKMDEEWAKR